MNDVAIHVSELAVFILIARFSITILCANAKMVIQAIRFQVAQRCLNVSTLLPLYFLLYKFNYNLYRLAAPTSFLSTYKNYFFLSPSLSLFSEF